MPAYLSLNTPPSTAGKRQRSAEGRERQPLSSSFGKGQSMGEEANQRLVRSGIRVPSYLNKNKTEIAATFQELEWKQRDRLVHANQNGDSSPYRVDRSNTAWGRNRYGNVQPWDNSRVKLQPPIGGSDYINASPISLKRRSPERTLRTTPEASQANSPQNSYDLTLNETKYIATQGPKGSQIPHFWHMVMQETVGDVGVIIMLTRCYELNKEKCSLYFPPNMANSVVALPALEIGNQAADDGDPFLDSDVESADADSDYAGTNPDGDATENICPDDSTAPKTEAGTVELISLTYDVSIGCEVRKLKLSIGNRTKEICHYLYNNWPDFGKPEAEDRMALLQLTRVSKERASVSPRFVHCSAGVGRTGTWIALDFLLRELEEGRLLTTKDNDPDGDAADPKTWGKSGPTKSKTPEAQGDDDLIQETVNTLREQRMMMVMNDLQFTFLYETLKDAFMDKYAEKETGPLVVEEEPSPKVARKNEPFGGMFEKTRIAMAQGEEDRVSEAETEIMDDKQDHALMIAALQNGLDPYAAVAPQAIQDGMKKGPAG